MKFKIHAIRNYDDGTVGVEVRLDEDLKKLLGLVDPACYMGSLSYVFPSVTSEAAIASAVRNDIARRKIVANHAGRLKHLVGKEFDV
ncbi:MAG: hypothetical protein ACRCSL_16750 [Microbacterium sp.]